MAKSFGIEVYEILSNGCLNGVYANIASNNELSNEVAKKKKEQNPEIDTTTDPIIGDYDCFFFEGNNRRDCTLKIEIGTVSQYFFTWFNMQGTQIFSGEGWKTNNHQITIQYR